MSLVLLNPGKESPYNTGMVSYHMYYTCSPHPNTCTLNDIPYNTLHIESIYQV